VPWRDSVNAAAAHFQDVPSIFRTFVYLHTLAATPHLLRAGVKKNVIATTCGGVKAGMVAQL